MKLPVHIAEKLLQLLQGDTVSSSAAKHAIIEDLIVEGIIERRGRIQKTLFITNKNACQIYLQSKYSINDLVQYIQTIKQTDVSRSQLVAASSDSKLKAIRTFKGFLVNSYLPLKASINGAEITLNPTDGIFQFIYDYEQFIIPSDVTVIGIENPENFREISKQRNLFEDLTPLFVSRYPQNQSKDLLKWLLSISNNYLHFGDFDLAGIGIYLNEYKKYLADRATFFIPDNIEEIIAKYGNRSRYNNQKENFGISSLKEKELLRLIEIMHKYKKGLDQEVFIGF
ncbi:MAG: hypothetical protein ABFD10_13690 [Prolixibacteraceae bacterium]